jgi:hypothetical protein
MMRLAVSRMQPSLRPRALAALVATLAAGIALAAAPEARAARASKPKEIVVVGSKVKDVVREAGFAEEGNVVAALGELVLRNLHAAMERAEKNGRYVLEPTDLSCPAAAVAGRRLTKAAIIAEIARDAGFEVGRGFLAALNDYADMALEQGLRRAAANGRSTVRPHDL